MSYGFLLFVEFFTDVKNIKTYPQASHHVRLVLKRKYSFQGIKMQWTITQREYAQVSNNTKVAKHYGTLGGFSNILNDKYETTANDNNDQYT